MYLCTHTHIILLYYVIQSQQHYKSPPSAAFSGKDFSIFLHRPRVKVSSANQTHIMMPYLASLLYEKPFSRKTRCVRSTVVMAVCKHHNIILYVAKTSDLSCDFYSIFRVCLPRCPSITADTLGAKCVHVQEMSSFRRNGYDITSFGRFGWKPRRRRCVHDTIRSDRILFYAFRVFPRNWHEFQTTVNAPGCSYCCCRYIYISSLLCALYIDARFGCTKESIFTGFYYARTDVRIYSFRRKFIIR